MDLYSTTTFKCSRLITRHYSTSFTLGIRTLDKKFHYPIYGIYGFVRYADEIVDTFHEFDKEKLLRRFWEDTYAAIDEGISMNPVLHSFQKVVHEYNIERELIESFLVSMEMDLHKGTYSEADYKKYIYGSAEVVGLMCLRVFCEGNNESYDRLKASARALGSAFQKVNFLRDIKSDFKERGRIYFPGIDFKTFTEKEKHQIEEDIQRDFDLAYQGILALPKGARLGVYLAYIYYLKLFHKIKNVPVGMIMEQRIRIPDSNKLALLTKTYFMHRLNFI